MLPTSVARFPSLLLCGRWGHQGSGRMRGVAPGEAGRPATGLAGLLLGGKVEVGMYDGVRTPVRTQRMPCSQLCRAGLQGVL
jgi:hypothetical protein